MASVTVTHSPDYNFDTESSNGPTSRTTTGQVTKMNSGDRIKKLMSDLSDSLVTLAEKEDEIKRLKEQNDALKDENDKLKQQQFKAPDQFTPPRNIEVTRKATELKKVLDDFLGPEPSYRHQRFPPISISPGIFPVNTDVNKSSTSTSDNPKLFRSDESATNGTSHINHDGNHNYNSQDDFSSSRPSDQDIVTQATQVQVPYYNNHGHGHSTFVPTTVNNLNGPPGRRFNGNGIGGMSNNNNIRNRNNNINNNNNNNNNNNTKYTIFIAWTGSVSTADQLRELFDPSDVVDIRYTPPKQFAHVDLKSESAMKKAMLLDQTTKNETQGQLRVETGKPRSSNNNNLTENGQRPQNQNKNYNNRQNNKNPNGYNNNLPQKHNNSNNKFNPNYNHYNRNNNNGQYPFNPTEEKENGTNGTNGTNSTTNWTNYANSVSNQQEPKSTGESH